MAHNAARHGRRRRVLNEEALTASAMGIAARSGSNLSCSGGDTPRYGAGANIENHPQITDYVPRHYRVIALVMLSGLGLGAGAQGIAHYAPLLSEKVPAISAAEITSGIAGGLVAWASAAALLVAACYARLIFSLRRHRVDDSRGRYRVWRWAAVAAVALSINSVVGAHAVVARMLGQLTGGSILPGNAGWWLAPATLIGGWLMMKLMIDSGECRTALLTYFLAGASLTAAGVACCWSPAWAAQWHEMLCRLLPLIGNVLLMTGTLLFARYVVLDVQGLIKHSPTPQPTRNSTVATTRQSSPDESAGRVETRPSRNAAATAEPDQDAWVDGSEPEESDHEGKRRLSKAERKRLRKQKARERAA